MNDPIVEEIRRIRDAHAAKFGYDLDAIFRDIKVQEAKSDRRFVSYEAERSQPALPIAPVAEEGQPFLQDALSRP